jgi:hypothetical protein
MGRRLARDQMPGDHGQRGDYRTFGKDHPRKGLS